MLHYIFSNKDSVGKVLNMGQGLTCPDYTHHLWEQLGVWQELAQLYLKTFYMEMIQKIMFLYSFIALGNLNVVLYVWVLD